VKPLDSPSVALNELHALDKAIGVLSEARVMKLMWELVSHRQEFVHRVYDEDAEWYRELRDAALRKVRLEAAGRDAETLKAEILRMNESKPNP
jgi:hypothetical protein